LLVGILHDGSIFCRRRSTHYSALRTQRSAGEIGWARAARKARKFIQDTPATRAELNAPYGS
jgi:hypothetical protein